MMGRMLPEQTLSRLSDLLASRMGLHFPMERWNDLERGLASAADAFGVSHAQACADWLLSTPLTRSQIETLASCLTVGETYFFRDECCFTALETQVLPELIRARSRHERRLRVWSAGCCTGEEAYSIAMLVDRLVPDAHAWTITILATDINPSFLRKAAAGTYTQWSFRGTPARLASMASYFHRTADHRYKINADLRKYVSFSYLNLADDQFPSMANNTNAMDIIFCRNVMQYFTAGQAERVCRKLQASLLEGGWLIVAPAETWLQPREGLRMVEFPGAIFYRKREAKETKPRPHPPAKAHVPSPRLATPGLHAAKLPTAAPTMASQTNKAVAAAPADAALEPFCYQQARHYANLGKLDEAAACCETAIAANRVDPIAQYLLAIIQQEQGRYEQAAQSLQRALYLDSSFALAHFSLGSLHASRGRPREARRSLRNALDLLRALPKEQVVPESEGLSAGRLADMVTALLASLGGAETANA
jgi:chemotaxis protein methyltransferase CheR